MQALVGASIQRRLMFIVAASAVLAAPAAAAAATGQPPTAALTAHSVSARVRGLIAYMAGGADNPLHIWSMRADGSHARQLTYGRRVLDQEPAVSPDGSRIAFVRIWGLCRATCAHEGIWVMNSDGSHAHKIASGPYVWPAWSPNGRLIAVSHNGSWLDVMHADGSHLHKIALQGVHQAVSPAWSPDGRRLAFTAVGGSDGQQELYTARPDGTGLRRLTHNNAIHMSPSWSPSGRRIAYSQAASGLGTAHLMIVRTDGTHLHSITSSRVSAYYAHYDMTGHWLLYEDEANPRQPRLHVIRPDGTRDHAINKTVSADEPSWHATDG